MLIIENKCFKEVENEMNIQNQDSGKCIVDYTCVCKIDGEETLF